MAGPLLRDRVRDKTTTTGTGTITLAGTPPSSFRSFGSALSNSDTCHYCIAHESADEWEVGTGTYTSSGTTLSRTSILASSNGGAAVNFSAGQKDVFITFPAVRGALLVEPQAANQVLAGPTSGGNAAAAFRALVAADMPSGVPTAAATQAEEEAGSLTSVYTTPGRQQYHPSACKFWINLNGTGTIAINDSYNVTSITDNGTGDYTVTIATDFSSANWSPYIAHRQVSGNTQQHETIHTIAAGSIRLNFSNSAPAFIDPDMCSVGGFGDQ